MSLLASVLRLDRKDIKALKMTDPYVLHRIVYSLFDDVRSMEEKQGSSPSGFLYADQGGDFQERRVLLLSDRRPKSQVSGGYGEVSSKPIPDRFLNHGTYRFKVVVNPTRRDSASRKLVSVRGRKAIADWFAERARPSWGFAISREHLQVGRVEVLEFKSKKEHPITLAQAHIEGVLQVEHPEKFSRSFRQGIGRARAFGCGLLQIVPIVDNPFA